MAKATKATLAKIHKAREALSAAQLAVFHVVANTSTPFQECYRLAPAGLRAKYDAARDAVAAAEQAAINAGQAWRGNSGLFYPYS